MQRKHLRESDEGDRVGAGATHDIVFSALELLGMDDPALPVHANYDATCILTVLYGRVSVLATMTGK